MTDDDVKPAGTVAPSESSFDGARSPRGGDQAVPASEVDDILNDTQMPVEERISRLQALAGQSGVRGQNEGQDPDPLLAQINEALNFLAEGGHRYGTAETAHDIGTSQPTDFGHGENRKT